MRTIFSLIFVASCAFAQDQATAPKASVMTEEVKPVLNIVVDRIGFYKKESYVYGELFQIRPIRGTKHWFVIVPDVGGIGFDQINRYREFYIGAGFEVVIGNLTLDHEAYYDQATGPDAHGKAYYQPWSRAEYKFPNHLVGEVVAFPYIPINGGHTQFVMERAKLEYAGLKRFSFGGGLGMYQDFSVTDLQKRPFVSVTVKTSRLGNFEFWIQAMPEKTFQIQFRHAISWYTRR